MSRLLADLLGSEHPLFAYNVMQMERAAGNSGVDMRLIVDITEKAHAVMRSLGFDPADTSALELYNALNVAAQNGKADQLLAGTHFVLLRLEDGPISFCLHDVRNNARQNINYEDRKVDHAQRHLKLEIVRRYAEHDRTDNTMIENIAEQTGLAVNDDEMFTSAEGVNSAATSNSKPTVLAIGDIFTDAFITLGDDAAKIINEDGVEWLAVPFGSKPPYQKVDIVKSVGPSPNVAVALSRLGLNAELMAWVGGDDTGEEALEYLKTQNVGTSAMIVEQDKATSYWYVLCYKADRTMLVKSEQYRYEWKDPAQTPDWIYLAYLGEDSWVLHEGLLDYLERNPEIKLALQPGTFQFKWGAEKLAGLYRRSHIVLMNREEAMDVTGRPYDSIKNLADGLHELGPEIAVITDGGNGSYASDGSRVLTIPNYPDKAPPLERTGAGDAFSSTFVAALAQGESIETALLWSPINSMNVVQEVGAQAGLQTHDQILEWLDKAPEAYKVSEHQD